MGLISRSPEQLGQTEREARASICSRMGSSIPGITVTISPICLNDGGLLRIVPYKRGYRTNAFGRFHLSGYATYQELAVTVRMKYGKSETLISVVAIYSELDRNDHVPSGSFLREYPVVRCFFNGGPQ